MYFYNVDEKIFSDLWLYHCGTQKCKPSHSFGPAVRKHYLIHFIHSGCGKFECKGKTYNLKQGQAFLISPGEVTYYEADKKNPWHYSWIEFGGIYAQKVLEECGLSQMPIYTAKSTEKLEESLNSLVNVCNEKMEQLEISGLLHLFLNNLIKSSSNAQKNRSSHSSGEYVKKAIEFIRLNYHRKVTITEICTIVGIERSYLCKIFKAHYGKSPQAYIVEYKMKKAADLISEMNLTVSQAARSVGYEDQAAFSKLFKMYFGYSPSKIKK
ncbi:MAG: AraC family transcriptional regulator [Ruminococcaceae bacterium]|nr:AraC family transcriptional regulator [Oscillospiraceae bacterium]